MRVERLDRDGRLESLPHEEKEHGRRFKKQSHAFPGMHHGSLGKTLMRYHVTHPAGQLRRQTNWFVLPESPDSARLTCIPPVGNGLPTCRFHGRNFR